MPRDARSWLLMSVTVLLPMAPGLAAAQTMQPGETTTRASLTVINQFDSDLDAGGKTGWAAIFVSGSASRQVTPEFTLGANAGYDYQNWRFSSPAAFGGRGPWDQINFFEVGLDFDYLSPSGLAVGISPTFGWQYESGAKTGDALEWGAVFTLAQVFSKDLTLGIGAGVFNYMEDRGTYDVSLFPIVKWQITDRLRVDNPFAAGISGGGGLELAYSFDDRWEVAAGASDRTYTFRLKNSGPEREWHRREHASTRCSRA